MGVDTWLKGLEKSMVISGKDQVFRSFAELGSQPLEEWINSWTG
jgi:hypothetical protein